MHDMLTQVESKEKDQAGLWSVNPNQGRGILVFDLPSEIINDFYDLKEYVRIANMRNQMTVLSVASSLPGEGSSTISTYLAYLLSGGVLRKASALHHEPVAAAVKDSSQNSGLFTADFEAIKSSADSTKQALENTLATPDVLLVDANFAQPSLHRLFQVEEEDGLAEVLERRLDWRTQLKPIAETSLSLLTAGKTTLNPAELLGSELFRALIQEWRKLFGFVVIDSPPVLTQVAALSLAAVVDGVVLVVRAGQTRWEVAQNAKRKLTAAHANVLGVALNRKKSELTENLLRRLN